MKKVIAAVAVGVTFALVVTATAMADPKQPEGHHLFLKSAGENDALTEVTLPLYRGTSGGDTVWYVITDASTRKAANEFRVNFAPKLANTANTAAVQHVTFGPSGIVFPATVDFAPSRYTSKGDYNQCAQVPFLPFDPTCFAEGADGNPGYSPLIQLPDGTVLDAAHVANSTGWNDKVVALDTAKRTVTLGETTGFYEGRTIHYISLDVSVPPGAVLEDATFAPSIGESPNDPANENEDLMTTSRAGIIAFTNGQNGLANPNRQGLNSTILDGPAGFTEIAGPTPLNIIQFIPQGVAEEALLYSPLWDMHFATWQVPYSERLRQRDFEEILENASITNPFGGPLGPNGAAVNCPIVSTDAKHVTDPR